MFNLIEHKSNDKSHAIYRPGQASPFFPGEQTVPQHLTVLRQKLLMLDPRFLVEQH
jgi:hypothetical protein